MLGLVDFFGASFIVFIMSIAEMVAIFWIYGTWSTNHVKLWQFVADLITFFLVLSGVNRLCRDTEFMSGRNPGLYWRLCWGVLTPAVMITILLYTFATYKPLTYRGYIYPDTAYGITHLLHTQKSIQAHSLYFFSGTKKQQRSDGR